MLIVNVLGFLALVYGLFALFNISIFSFIEESRQKANRFSLKKKKTKIAQRVKEARKEQKKVGIIEIIYSTRQMLILTGRTTFLSWISFLSMLLFVIGVVVALIINNIFLVPILGGGFALMPFIYVLLLSVKWQQELNEEMETALSIITTSYIRKEDIITAISDNVSYLNEPLKSVFENFLVNTRYINSNTKEAIRTLRDKVHHDVFREWCDALIICQDNKEQKTVLSPIVKKISDTRLTNEKLNNLLYLPLKEYIMSVILFLANYPILKMINEEWYQALTGTMIGKFVIAITTGMLLFSIPSVAMLTRSVSYKDE